MSLFSFLLQTGGGDAHAGADDGPHLLPHIDGMTGRLDEHYALTCNMAIGC